jgi:hypothetical protein
MLFRNHVVQLQLTDLVMLFRNHVAPPVTTNLSGHVVQEPCGSYYYNLLNWAWCSRTTWYLLLQLTYLVMLFRNHVALTVTQLTYLVMLFRNHVVQLQLTDLVMLFRNHVALPVTTNLSGHVVQEPCGSYYYNILSWACCSRTTWYLLLQLTYLVMLFRNHMALTITNTVIIWSYCSGTTW